MLKIHGRKVKSIDSRNLRREFGYSYERSKRLGDWIAALMEDRVENKFHSVAEMRSEFINRNIHNPLPIRFVNPNYPQGVVINMTGSRTRDIEEANAAIGVKRTPAGYTWHHCENIMIERGEYRCTMMLIKSRYHNKTPHKGGVNEYEVWKNTPYH
ncbi:MAG: HNH endonuclease [Oscillospiraceae bacterium]|nr:HNH endonuclease [Oscillospiraceae bacterium]